MSMFLFLLIISFSFPECVISHKMLFERCAIWQNDSFNKAVTPKTVMFETLVTTEGPMSPHSAVMDVKPLQLYGRRDFSALLPTVCSDQSSINKLKGKKKKKSGSCITQTTCHNTVTIFLNKTNDS